MILLLGICIWYFQVLRNRCWSERNSSNNFLYVTAGPWWWWEARLRAHGPSFVGRPFRRCKAVTPSTTLHGPTLARGRASAPSRGREEVKRQCSDGGFCRQNLVSEKRRLHVISSDLQPPSGLLHPHPTCRCPRPEASCRTHPPYHCCCGLSAKAGLCFSWLRGAPGLCAVQPAALRLLFGRRAACCPAPVFWASHLLPSLLR